MAISYRTKDNPTMDFDPARARLLALVTERNTDLATVSRAIKKNHAYLQQFINRHTPRHLPEAVREALGLHFSLDPDEFRGTPQSRPQPSAIERKLVERIRSLSENEQGFLLRGFDGWSHPLAEPEAPPVPAAPRRRREPARQPAPVGRRQKGP